MKMEDGRMVHRILCHKHKRMCLTTKCPFAKYECYSYPDFDLFYGEHGMGARRGIASIVKEVLDEQVQSAEDNG